MQGQKNADAPVKRPALSAIEHLYLWWMGYLQRLAGLISKSPKCHSFGCVSLDIMQMTTDVSVCFVRVQGRSDVLDWFSKSESTDFLSKVGGDIGRCSILNHLCMTMVRWFPTYHNTKWYVQASGLSPQRGKDLADVAVRPYRCGEIIPRRFRRYIGVDLVGPHGWRWTLPWLMKHWLLL